MDLTQAIFTSFIFLANSIYPFNPPEQYPTRDSVRECGKIPDLTRSFRRKVRYQAVEQGLKSGTWTWVISGLRGRWIPRAHLLLATPSTRLSQQGQVRHQTLSGPAPAWHHRPSISGRDKGTGNRIRGLSGLVSGGISLIHVPCVTNGGRERRRPRRHFQNRRRAKR